MTQANLQAVVTPRDQVLAERRRHYETIYVLNPSLGDSEAEAILNRMLGVMEKSGATILRKDQWGKLKLAMEMKKHQQGRFIYLRYIGSSDTVKALERNLKIDPNMIVFQTVRLSDDFLSQEEIDDLVRRAPTEESVSPTAWDEDEGDY